MQEARRARPTLRLLREDLADGWEQGYSLRRIREGKLFELHPLSSLPHPIIRKASESIGEDPASDNHEGKIRGSTSITLLEIKIGQWRGAVWQDPESQVHWLIAAGLAKGGHQDHDDFYFRVEQANLSGTIEAWLPTDEDLRLLKQEVASRLITQWELAIQRAALAGLSEALRTGKSTFEVLHPADKSKTMAFVKVEVEEVKEPDYTFDDALVAFDFSPGRSQQPRGRSSDVDNMGGGLRYGTSLEWHLTTRVLASLNSARTRVGSVCGRILNIY